MHATLGEEIFSGVPRTAKAFEKKNSFGKFLLHPRNDVLPGGHGNFVASVAAEAIHAAATPDDQGVGDKIPEFNVVLFKFDQVFPNGSPSAGADEFAGRTF